MVQVVITRLLSLFLNAKITISIDLCNYRTRTSGLYKKRRESRGLVLPAPDDPKTEPSGQGAAVN